MKIGSVFVTGANRGIGLELVRQLVNLKEAPDFVFATYRCSEDREALELIEKTSAKSRFILIKMDVRNQEDIRNSKQIVEEYVRENGLNLLINNAGWCKNIPFPKITPELMEEHFRVNTVAPVMILQEFLPLLEKAANSTSAIMSASHAAVLNISSMAGSIFNTGQIFTEDLIAINYKISKAALNMAMRVAAAELKDKGILVVLMCPGWVKTDMGTEQAEINVETSISDILKALPHLDETNHGGFIDRFGNKYDF